MQSENAMAWRDTDWSITEQNTIKSCGPQAPSLSPLSSNAKLIPKLHTKRNSKNNQIQQSNKKEWLKKRYKRCKNDYLLKQNQTI